MAKALTALATLAICTRIDLVVCAHNHCTRRRDVALKGHSSSARPRLPARPRLKYGGHRSHTAFGRRRHAAGRATGRAALALQTLDELFAPELWSALAPVWTAPTPMRVPFEVAAGDGDARSPRLTASSPSSDRRRGVSTHEAGASRSFPVTRLPAGFLLAYEASAAQAQLATIPRRPAAMATGDAIASRRARRAASAAPRPAARGPGGDVPGGRRAAVERRVGGFVTSDAANDACT